MNQDFKLKFEELRENDPSRTDYESEPISAKDENYHSYGNTRNICFISLNGNRIFLNYAYLVAGEYFPNDSAIILGFTTHQISLKGHSLDELFAKLMLQIPRIIAAVDNRYNVSMGTSPVVNEIQIKDV